MTLCELELLGGDLVRVRWRSHATFPPGVKQVGVKLSADRVRDLQYKGWGARSPTVVRLGRRVAVLFDLERDTSLSPGVASQAQVELAYTCRAGRRQWTQNVRVWFLALDILPRLYFRDGQRPRQWVAGSATPESTRAATRLSLTWDAATVRVFGPVSDPESGRADLTLSAYELADFQVCYGPFRLAARGGGFAVWVPVSNSSSSLESSCEFVVTSAARVRDYLVHVFGKAQTIAEHIVLAPAMAGSAQYLGRAVLIRDPRDAAEELSGVREADLMAQLAHELSHSWWIPAVVNEPDRRVWGLIEGVAVASEFLAIEHFVSADVRARFVPRRKAHHCNLLSRRISELLRHYRSPEAAAGLRIGYVLIALMVSERRAVLEALRRLLRSFNPEGPRLDGFPARMAEAFGPEFASVLLETLGQPRPPIASVRMRGGAQGGTEVALHLDTTEEVERVLRLLSRSRAFVSQLQGVTGEARTIRLNLSAGTSADWVQHLTPGFVMDRGIVQWNRVDGSRVLRTLSEFAWKQRARAGHYNTLDRFRCAFMGLAEMLMESEAAVGYELLADALDGWISPVARRLRKAAGARATW